MNLKSVISMIGVLLAVFTLQACKHPLAIVGEGDVVDANNSGRGCTLEQFQGRDAACINNEVSGDYFVNYKAEPRPGWRFARWDGPCPPDSEFQHCRFSIAKATVDWWDATYPDADISPSTAVFQPITGETGYLLAGTPVAGVAYETPTQQGVTGQDGSFQYEEGETIRFRIGDTLLGEVTGREKVTPFELAGSAVVTGLDIYPALEDEQDPFQTVINITVLLQSLDRDAEPDNGIQISQGVAALFQGVELDVSQYWARFQNESTLRRAVAQANRGNLFSTSHWVVKPAAAAEQLYGSLGIVANTIGITLLQFKDENGNLTKTGRFQYDASGNLVRHDDGTADAFENWQYDANGNLIRYELDAVKYEDTIGGGTRFAARFIYNSNGNVIRTELDDNADGSADDVQVVTWKYDRNRNPRYVDRHNGIDGDPANPDFIGTWKYDIRGNLIRKKEEFNGVDCRYVSIWYYNTQGKMIHSKAGCDLLNAGPDTVETWNYDAGGNLVRHETDSTLNLIETWEYDSNGNLTRYGEVAEPLGWYSFTNWHYNASGSVAQIDSQWSNDRSSGKFTEFWQYDIGGKAIRRERRREDGARDELETWQYDAEGRVIRRELRDGYTLTQVETWRYQYDAAVTRTETQYIGLEGTTIYQYRATGWAHLFTHYQTEAAKIRFAYPDSPWWLNYYLPEAEPIR